MNTARTTAWGSWCRGEVMTSNQASVMSSVAAEADAWFDVMTSPRHQLPQAIVLAVVIELPLAGVCAWLSFHTEHLADRRLSVLPARADRFSRARNSRLIR